MKKLYALIALPALLLSPLAHAGINTPPLQGVNTSRVQAMQQINLFDNSIDSLRFSLIGTQVWTDALRMQFDTLRQDVLNLDILLDRVDVDIPSIQQQFSIVNQDFMALRSNLQSFPSGQLGASFDNHLTASINAFSVLQNDISAIQ